MCQGCHSAMVLNCCVFFSSGIISTAKVLDRETKDSYTLRIQVNDADPERVSFDFRCHHSKR